MRAEDLPYRWRDERGEWQEGLGRLYRPDDDGQHALIYHAGYEADPLFAEGWTRLGAVVVTPRLMPDDGAWPHGNPLGRGLKLDESLLRAARTLPYVDDARVLITGGSAGGWMTLMMSAATFPLAGAFPIVPPVNLAYQLATWHHNLDEIRALRPGSDKNVMAHPGSPGICGLWQALTDWHGTPGGSRLWQWSPLAHLDRVTCPVVMIASSADALVPVPQYGGPLSAMAIAGSPEVYPIDPDEVCTGLSADLARRTLLEMLDPDDVTWHVLPVPPETPLMVEDGPAPEGAIALTAPERERRWLVMFLDEGPPGVDVGHFKHAVGVDIVPPAIECLAEGPSPAQLTPAKLEVLVDRWLGLDWVEPDRGARDLTTEELEAERADVSRGIRTFVGISPEHAAQFEKLWGQLDEERKTAATGMAP